MAALVKDRDTRRRDAARRTPGLAANAVIFAGAIIVRTAAGFAAPATTALGLHAMGIALDAVDNTGGTDGAKAVDVDSGIYQVANSAGADEITAADIGNDCYLVDDQTVAKTNGAGTRSAAGTVFDVDAKGVWVEFK